MRIVNNNIEILRGETATYDVNVIDDKNGYPYTVENINNPYIEFTVKKSVLDKDPVFRTYISMSSVSGISPYVEGNDLNTLLDPPLSESDWYKLYKYTVDNNYYYYNGTEWIQYNFNITFTFPYEKVSKFEVKTYKYQITLLGGTLKSTYDANECPLNVSYSEPILKPHDFVVGGSLSE